MRPLSNRLLFTKVIITYLICILSILVLRANPEPTTKPERIYSITRVVYPMTYYAEQAKLWKLETQKDNQNAWAWLNYYEAARYANLFARIKKVDAYFDMTKVYADLSKAIPNTYEYHLISYEKSGGDIAQIDHLHKAYEIAPDRFDTYPNFLSYYERIGDVNQAKLFAKKWYDSGEISSGVLSWNYNVLMSLEENAVLITHGDNATYPLWILQHVKNIRPDVAVLNVHLIMQDAYRNYIFSKNSIAPFPKNSTHFSDGKANYYDAVTNHVLTHSQRPVYLSTTMSNDLRDQHSDNLYWVGLVFKHSEQEFDNVSILKNNYENNFLTDYLKVDLTNDISQKVVHEMNLNYIPPFMVLHKHYRQSGEFTKANNLKDLTIKVAKNGGKEKEIRSYLEKQSRPKPKLESVINIKQIDKAMKPIKGNLFAAETELTNAAYEEFLMDLLKHKEFDLLEKCKIHPTDWRALLPEKFRDLSDEVIFQYMMPNDPQVPVKNISYQAAREYCKWLTTVYNQTDKKRKYQEVKFRLPTEAEWEHAARALNNKDAPYPWGGYYCQNEKGCYLSNFYVTEEAPNKEGKFLSPANDGAYFAGNADTYFPNDNELYGMCGNVAEMVQEEGIAKGGSWEDVPEECTITFKKEYEKPSPAIGFRVFMEVIKQ